MKELHSLIHFLNAYLCKYWYIAKRVGCRIIRSMKIPQAVFTSIVHTKFLNLMSAFLFIFIYVVFEIIKR